MAEDRNKYFACLVYPESAPENWIEILKEQHLKAFISPLHDQDVEKTGEIKKPHYHVIIMFTSLKSPRQAKEVFEKFCGVGCESINSLPVMARYLCHLDDPDKALYDKKDVIEIGGADYFDIIEMNTDRYIIIQEMLDFCEEYNIISFAKLFDYARQCEKRWFRSLCDNSTYVIKEYLKSKKWEQDITLASQNPKNLHNLSFANSSETGSEFIE